MTIIILIYKFSNNATNVWKRFERKNIICNNLFELSKNRLKINFALRFEKQMIEKNGKIKLKFSLPNPKYIIIFVTDFLTDAWQFKMKLFSLWKKK